MRCLVVDDDPDVRSLVERILRARGMRVECADGANAALAAVARERFDVALVDLGMPGTSGAELLRELRAWHRDLRLLVLSGFDDRRHVFEALEAGASGYLVKDEIADRLVASVQEVAAGFSPLSSRVGAVVVKAVAEMRGSQKARDPAAAPAVGAATATATADGAGAVTASEDRAAGPTVSGDDAATSAAIPKGGAFLETEALGNSDPYLEATIEMEPEIEPSDRVDACGEIVVSGVALVIPAPPP